jgi:hypothetical protein
MATIEWARWPWQRCKARLGREANGVYWGRCDRRKAHPGKHLLERGMDQVGF